MNVMNCRGCGRLFNALSDERICPECRKKLDDKFVQVKAYLEEHKGASIDEVATENEVTVKQIKQWIREERLSLSDGSLDGIECENCGQLIKTGRFCDSCKGKLASTLSTMYAMPSTLPEQPKKKSGGSHMRFI